MEYHPNLEADTENRKHPHNRLQMKIYTNLEIFSVGVPQLEITGLPGTSTSPLQDLVHLQDVATVLIRCHYELRCCDLSRLEQDATKTPTRRGVCITSILLIVGKLNTQAGMQNLRKTRKRVLPLVGIKNPPSTYANPIVTVPSVAVEIEINSEYPHHNQMLQMVTPIV